jgi:membrane-bound serine protease (ClpP class)
VNWWLLTIVLIFAAALIAFLVILVLRTYRNQVSTGGEDLIGKTAQVKETLDSEGIVMYLGDLWNAQSVSGKIEAGEEVIITAVQGLKLQVKKYIKE